MTTTLGTSNIRGGPSGRRVNPGRTSKTVGSSLRQNSLVSNSGLPLPSSVTATNNQTLNGNDPPGMYPAITHFADAISALPREFRRHQSLLKEVDAKAWANEESLENVLEQCLADTRAISYETALAAQSLAASVTGDDPVNSSEVQSVAGASVDAASLASARSTDPASLQRRHLHHALRQNLIAIMQTMDEKNHVITNANEEVARHMRRLDNIWPHISEEISEEARLGSLKHWAYTETNSTKKPAEPAPRGRPGENEVAARSQTRRDDVQAKRQRAVHHADSDFDESRPPTRKAHPSSKKRVAELGLEPPGLGISNTGAAKRKKPDRLAGGAGMERSISSALGGRAPAMSRENSQQDNLKKRKASQPTTVARKRINAQNHDSPKLASSPLAGPTGKEGYKRSPALSAVRPAAARGRQNSTQNIETTRGRQPSIASVKNGNHNVTAHTQELNSVAALTGKTANEVKSTMKETKTDKGDRLLEDEPAINGANGEPSLRGALLLERPASKQEGLRRDAEEVSAKAMASPRFTPLLLTNEVKNERVGRGRASKTSTPIVSTFAEADESDRASVNGNSRADGSTKSRRPTRPRMKDHGLHDSLSPKGLPVKRSHKKNGSLSVYGPTSAAMGAPNARTKDENDGPRSATPAGSDRLGGGGGLEHEEDDDIENDPDMDAENEGEDEERYCYCQGVSYGEMVACDKADCPRQWFHLECIGLKSVPKSAKWYCDECKEALAKKGKPTTGNGDGNGNGNGHGNGNGNGNGNGSGNGK